MNIKTKKHERLTNTDEEVRIANSLIRPDIEICKKSSVPNIPLKKLKKILNDSCLLLICTLIMWFIIHNAIIYICANI